MSARPAATAAATTAAATTAAATAALRTKRTARAVGLPEAPTSVFQNVTKKSATELSFVLSPTHVTYANTLRRAMITEVETVGFRSDIIENGSTTDVKIFKNSTPMSNEMLAHRIGLLPLHVTNPLEWNPEEYEFTLNVTNESSEPMDIVASDITVLKARGPEEEPLKVPSVQFFHPDPVTRDTALLAVLKGRVGTQEPESLHFTARASLGTGRENARFMPVTSRCSYGYSLDEDPDRQKEFFTKWLVASKKGNPTELEANPTRKAELEREFKAMEKQRCFKIDGKGEPYSFDFTVESVGVLDPAYVVRRALEVLQAKLLRYASMDAGSLPEGVKAQPADARMKGFDFVFQNEDHTLGNLLQTWMEQNLMDAKEITFAGYKVPHPLRDEMLLRVGVEDGMELTARAAIAKAARGCAQIFKDWLVQWTS